jgi:HlyD family secretion protein
MTAAVSIVVRQIDDALLVPNRAVRVVDGQRVVYIMQDGSPELVIVELGVSSDLYSEVVGGGLQEGDVIMLRGVDEAELNPGRGGFMFGGMR